MSKLFFRLSTAFHARLIKLTGGRMLMAGPNDGQALVLTHRGARSGKVRDTPLMFLNHNGGYAIAGTVAGDDHHPGWYFNLQANPTTEVFVGGETVRVRARLTEGEERSQLWTRFAETAPNMANYSTRTDREFPIFVLERS